MQMTVPVSSHALKNGSQYPEWIDGRPSQAASSDQATALTPRAAFAADLRRRQFDIPQWHQTQRAAAGRRNRCTASPTSTTKTGGRLIRMAA